jgi:exopolyphosphatase/guanosine-5'-triphosphate,3'-diphosphate pyrophosphatase
MDIGGGSTEFVGGARRGDSVSLPIGVVVSLGIHSLSDPPEAWQVRNLSHFYRERIDAGASALRKRPFRALLGTAGTFTTLAALDLRMKRYDPARIDGHSMSLPRLAGWTDRLLRMTDAERLALPGMEKGRERYIVPGALQALAAMERFRLDRLVASDAGILEGIVMELIESNAQRKGEHTWKRA